LFVILAFSGGGTRAAALSYGVLKQLEEVKFKWDAASGNTCEPTNGKMCEGPERSLLDEVDVISSVSGGSFTAAYYALHGADMLKNDSPFKTAFLNHPVQGDLFTNAIYHPRNWNRLLSRIEIASSLYSDRIFEGATFGALESKPRPYIILNAADMSTGARFEFTQEQFDLLCANLSDVPLARGVAASSAFPGLLNSMTIDSHNKAGCGYYGPGSTKQEKIAAGAPFDVDFDWVDLALKDQFSNYPRYRKALQLLDYRKPDRTHLHLLDGGISDNIGLRAVYQSISSTDRPAHRAATNATPILGGWSVLHRLEDPGKIKTIVVITVNAKTNKDQDWDTKSRGPSTISVLGVSRGVPMSGFTYETIELMRQFGLDAHFNEPGQPRLYAAEVAFENLPEVTAAQNDEKTFFFNRPTSFELSTYEVDCLADRGATLLRTAQSFGEIKSTSFVDFVTKELHGAMTVPDMPHPAVCDEQTGKKAIGVRRHYVDIGVQFGATLARGDVAGSHGFGITGRARRPDGFGAIVGFGKQSFTIRNAIAGNTVTLGELSLWAFTGSVGFSTHPGRLETTVSMGGGYGFGGFALATSAQDAYARTGAFAPKSSASNAWVVSPGLSLWYELNNRFAATASVGYTYARPTMRIDFENGSDERRVTAGAAKLGIGLGYKLF
jgi:NTE family protein